MIKYMLISCCERNISPPEFYDTYAEAWDEMNKQFKDVNVDDEGECGDWEAFGSTKNHDNIDWQIFELEVGFDFWTQRIEVK